MLFGDSLASDVSHEVNELIDRHHLFRTDVHWPRKRGGPGPRPYKPLRAFDAFSDIEEGTRLHAVAPYLDLIVTVRHGDLATDRGRSFLLAASPSAKWAEDVVIPRNERLDAIVAPIGEIQPLTEQLSQPYMSLSGAAG